MIRFVEFQNQLDKIRDENRERKDRHSEDENLELFVRIRVDLYRVFYFSQRAEANCKRESSKNGAERERQERHRPARKVGVGKNADADKSVALNLKTD